MADKVVQLVDKDNNNVYPIAGALAQGSVNTSTINDGAVTVGKMNVGSFYAGDVGDGWALQYLPSGKKMWTKRSTQAVTVNGHDFTGGALTSLPTGVSSADVYATGSIITADNALTLSIGVSSNNIKYTVYNGYSSSISTTAVWSVVLIEI